MKLNAQRRLLGSANELQASECHGHVVPRPDGMRAKCGGPDSPSLRCAVCAREKAALASGSHPLNSGQLTASVEENPGVRAKTRVEAKIPFEKMPHKLELKFGFHDEELKTQFINWLSAVSWCGGVGHSATIAMFVDGDGAGQMRIEGLPAKDQKVGEDMADAAANHGDSLMVEIGPSSAMAYSTQYDEGDRTYYSRTSVYPKSKD